MARRDEFTPIAESIPFDNTTPGATGMTSEEVQSAIEELRSLVNTSASPGFSFGRSGSVAKGAFLTNETVPSNVVGRFIYVNNASIKEVFVGNENLGTFKYEILYHDINETNLTLVGTITVTANYGGTFPVNWSIPTGKYLAVRVASDSVDAPKNVVCGLELRGTV